MSLKKGIGAAIKNSLLVTKRYAIRNITYPRLENQVFLNAEPMKLKVSGYSS